MLECSNVGNGEGGLGAWGHVEREVGDAVCQVEVLRVQDNGCGQLALELSRELVQGGV